MDKSYASRGNLKEIQDSLIYVDFIGKHGTKFIKVEDIKYLEFRKKGSLGAGVIIGGFIGLGIGRIIGYASGDDDNHGFTKRDKAFILGWLCILPGAVIGGIIGSVKVTIPIYGSQNNYKNQKARMEKYKYK